MTLVSLSHTLWLVPCYALAGTVLALLWSPRLIRQTGPRPAGYLNLLLTLIGLVHSVLAFIYLSRNQLENVSWQWLTTQDLSISLDLQFSALSAGALIVISALNFLAQIYAIGYLETDWGWARF